MLKDLRRYEHFGNPKFFYNALHFLKNNQNNPITKAQLNRFFYNQNIDNKFNFHGAIELAIKINILVEDKELITIDSEFLSLYDKKNDLQSLILEFFFKEIGRHDIYSEIFNVENVGYSYETNKPIIKTKAFKLQLSNVKKFLIDFGFLIFPKESCYRYYFINHNYFKLLNTETLLNLSKKKIKISVSDFEKNLELKNKYGYEAELFVYNYEINRLLDSKIKLIDWVSLHTVNEGYDIASYNSSEDSNFNRFIEVKSYDGNTPYFYLSENEYLVAQKTEIEYWIYLVNRSDMNEAGYQPIMIQNPSKAIFENPTWKINELKTYKFSQTIS